MAVVTWNAQALANQEWGGNICDDLYVVETELAVSTTRHYLTDHWWCLDPNNGNGLDGTRHPEVLLRWP